MNLAKMNKENKNDSILTATAILLVFGFGHQRRFQPFVLGRGPFVYLDHLLGDVLEQLVDVLRGLGRGLHKLYAVLLGWTITSIKYLTFCPPGRRLPFWTPCPPCCRPACTLPFGWCYLNRFIKEDTCSFHCTNGRCSRNSRGPWCRTRWWCRWRPCSSCWWWSGIAIAPRCPTKHIINENYQNQLAFLAPDLDVLHFLFK